MLVERQARYRKEVKALGAQLNIFTSQLYFFFDLKIVKRPYLRSRIWGFIETGLSFRTRDANLIPSFTDILERRWSQALDSDKIATETS